MLEDRELVSSQASTCGKQFMISARCTEVWVNHPRIGWVCSHTILMQSGFGCIGSGWGFCEEDVFLYWGSVLNSNCKNCSLFLVLGGSPLGCQCDKLITSCHWCAVRTVGGLTSVACKLLKKIPVIPPFLNSVLVSVETPWSWETQLWKALKSWTFCVSHGTGNFPGAKTEQKFWRDAAFCMSQQSNPTPHPDHPSPLPSASSAEVLPSPKESSVQFTHLLNLFDFLFCMHGV